MTKMLNDMNDSTDMLCQYVVVLVLFGVTKLYICALFAYVSTFYNQTECGIADRERKRNSKYNWSENK